MTDGDIKVGDVVQDLGQSGAPKMQVVGIAAETVSEYSEREGFDLAGYKNHPQLPVTESDPVHECVYLPDDPGTTPAGNNPYAIPAGRLARVPVEEANQDLRRFQHDLAVDLLETLIATAAGDDMAASADAIVDVATHAGLPEHLVDEAAELAEAAQLTPPEDGDEP